MVDGEVIDFKGKQLGLDDARIMLTAIKHESTMVTNNLKDFLTLLVFDIPLWEPMTNRIIVLASDAKSKLKEDNHLQELVNEVRNNFAKTT